MTTQEINHMAEMAVKAIKSNILTQKKEFAKLPRKDYYAWHKQYPYTDLGITLKHGWEGAKDEKYRLTINPNWHGHDIHIAETDSLTDLKNVIRAVNGLLNQLKSERGWKCLTIVYDYAEFGNGWYKNKVEYPSMVSLPDAPCSEFKSLQNYIKKYAGANLPNFYVYHVRMGGKRGTLYAEEGERIYLDNQPKKCETLLAELRKFRGTNDKMSVTFRKENYINPIDRAYSERHEIECDGEGRSYMYITIETPTRKVKYEKKIY